MLPHDPLLSMHFYLFPNGLSLDRPPAQNLERRAHLSLPQLLPKDKTSLSRSLAETYNVLDRSIRDIWGCRAFVDVTRPYWTANDHAAAAVAVDAQSNSNLRADGVSRSAK